MSELLTWIERYSPPVVLLLILGAAFVFVARMMAERGVERQFERYALRFTRRSAFEEKVLNQRFDTLLALNTTLEQLGIWLNRHRHGGSVPDGTFVNQEFVPLTQFYVDLQVQRLILGEDVFRALRGKAELLLQNDLEPEAWEAATRQLHEAMEAALGLRNIRW